MSVVIPAYNSAGYLRQSIESALAQTRRPLEVIVIDDGSTDDTREVARAYPVRYVYQSNRDRAVARNHGARLATGRLIAFLDADDVWLREHLALSVAALEREPSAPLSASDYLLVDASLRPIGQATKTSREQSLESLLVENSIATSAVVVRAGAFRAVGGFDESLEGSEDWELWLRLTALAPAVRVEAVTMLYRVHPASASSRALDALPERLFRACDRIYASSWLPPRLVRLRRRTYAWSALLVAVNYALNRRRGHALRWLARAVGSHPAVLGDRRWLATALRTLLPTQVVAYARSRIRRIP